MTVRALLDSLKPIPPLAPDDSAARAVRLMRARGVPAVPVAAGSQLVGLVCEADLAAAVSGAPDPRGALRATPLSQVMRPMPFVVREGDGLQSLVEALRADAVPAVPVAAADGRYLGMLLPREALSLLLGEPTVPPIAGLATPLGVYLTTGALRAGAGDFGLAATGAALLALNLLAEGIVAGAARLLSLAAAAPSVGPPTLADIVITYALQLVLFLALLRFCPLTGIHAAEHMVVSAIEEGEDLTPEKVRKMPRVHPRCGTNLMALVVLIGIAYQLLSSVRRINPEVHALALVLLVLMVALSWRRLGAGLQRWVTTKRPSDRQLARAIGVGEELLTKVRENPGARASARLRTWHTGFVQVLAGFLLPALAIEYLPQLIAVVWH
ncbi:MAG: DUF1385 domain-containing protein [Armatimonadota bacterium]